MANDALPTINGVDCSWAELAATLTPTGAPALETLDFAAIKWSDKVDVGERRGTSGGRVMHRTRGSVSQDASMTLYRSSHKRLIGALAAIAPRRGNQALISLVAFDILCQHTPIGTDEIFTAKIKGCRIVGRSDDNKEGNESDKIEVALNPIQIVELIDGVEIVLI